MVGKLAAEVTDLKNDNLILKREVNNLHSLIEASHRPHSQYIPREQNVLPAASIQRVPVAPSSTQALPAVSIPAETNLQNLSYRDIAANGISPSGPAVVPDTEGFKTVTYKKKSNSSSPAEITAVNKVKPRRQPLIGAGSSQALPVIAKPERSKALFVSRFSPQVTAEDIRKSLKEQLSLKFLVCTRLRTKFDTYASFHISVTVDEFLLINNTGVWPSGCLIAPFYGKLTPDQIFTPSTPEPASNPAGNDGADGGSSTPT
jgi:hypothetical protein